MARKSAALRKQQANNLLQEYTATPERKSFFSWEVNFLTDIVARLSRGKVLSKRQRARVDNMIDEGVRQIPQLDEEEELKYTLVAKWFAGHQFANVSSDFKARRLRGQQLSEKQNAWFNKMVDDARAYEDGQAWIPSESDIQNMEMALECSKLYDSNYWYSHASGSRSLHAVESYLKGHTKIISKRDVEGAIHAVRGMYKSMVTPKFSNGESCYIRRKFWNDTDRKYIIENFFGLIVRGPYIGERDVMYDVLADGKIHNTPHKQIYKRRG